MEREAIGEPPGLLSADTAAAYLARRGLIAPGAHVTMEALGGGVSNVVLAARTDDRAMVLKQSLPRLRVADEWLVKRERVLTEAAALSWAGAVAPRAVPSVLDVDPAQFAITIALAPDDWRPWKDLLLAGQVDPAVAARLGSLLAAWHSASAQPPSAPVPVSEQGDRPIDVAFSPDRFDDPEAFEQLRIDPYYRTILAKHPAVAGEIAGYIDRMAHCRRCLVHGDYSPKNVLVGPDGLWVLDFEVAHLGDPAFDLAFMLNHLALKAIHRPAHADRYEACALSFWRSYQRGVPPGFAGPTSYVLGHLGCLMLARVDGKSPAEYLTAAEQARARSLALSLLAAPPASLERVWRMLEEIAR